MWGKPFEDECASTVKFDKPEPCHGEPWSFHEWQSIFHQTCAPTPWLQGKHTIFGEVTKGLETLRKLRTSKPIPRQTNKRTKNLENHVKVEYMLLSCAEVFPARENSSP